MSAAAALAFLAGALAAVAAADLARVGVPALRARAPRLAGGAAALVETVARAGREGRDPGAAERRRLLAAGALAALGAGAMLAGAAAGVVLAAAGPWLVARLLRARRARYRRAVDAGAAAMALAIADALGGGHSLRGAIAQASDGLPGAAGHELRRVARELALGAPTDEALDAMRARCRSHAIDTIVAAALLQRRAGGDLARLLREAASQFEDHARLLGEVRAATAQARFTGLVVAVLPAGAAGLAELASPGYLGGLAGSFLTAWLAGVALVLQAIGLVAIRRLGRVEA
ncbi:MAG: type II secretion system F family protein [Thermoleophilaceae bacterium]